MGIDRTTNTDAHADKVDDPQPTERPPRPPDQPGLEPEGVSSRLESRKIAAANAQTTESPGESEDDKTDESVAEKDSTVTKDEPESPSVESAQRDESADEGTSLVTPSDIGQDISSQSLDGERDASVEQAIEATAEQGEPSTHAEASGETVEPEDRSTTQPERGPQINQQEEQIGQQQPATDGPNSIDATSRNDAENVLPVDDDVEWQQHVEQMKDKWAEFEASRPPDGPQEDSSVAGGPSGGEVAYEPVPLTDRPQDEPGSWRGEGGQYLNYEEAHGVSRVFERADGGETELTERMPVHALEVEGARLVGLENRLKSEDRFKEKAAEHLAAEFREDPVAAAEKIPDAIRYTYQIPDHNYVQGYRQIVDRLKDDGCEIMFSRNFWDDPEYKGINTRWRTSTGQLFEVQFHTPKSFEAKQVTHEAYERIRNPLTDYREVEMLEQFQREVSSKIPIPDGVSDIANYRREGY